MTEVGVGYVSIVPSAKGFAAALATQVEPQIDAVAAVSSARMSSRLMGVGKAMTAFVTLPLVAMGAAGVGAALKVDEALDQLAARTGATGEELTRLQNVFRRVGAGSTQDLNTVAQVVADLNTRLGLTGDTLEDTASRMLDLARITGVDAVAATAAITRAMNDFGVQAEDARLFMDQLLVASQKTGIGVDVLADKVAKFGSPMRLLGFTVEQTIAMLASFEKAGVRTETVMAGMRMAVSRLAEEGRDIPTAFGEYITAIQSAATQTEAAALASELFGSRAGPDMALAIREGRLSVDELVASLTGAQGALDSTVEATDGTQESLARLRNSLDLFLSQIGEELTPTIDRVAGMLDKWAQSFADLDENTRSTIVNVGLFVAAIGPVAWIVGALVGNFGTLLGTLRMLGPAFALLSGPVGWIALGIAAVAGAVMLLWNNSEAFRAVVQDIWVAIQESIAAAVAEINKWLQENQATIANLKLAWDQLVAIFEGTVLPAFRRLTEEVLPQLNAALGGLVPYIMYAAAAFAFLVVGIWIAIGAIAAFTMMSVSYMIRFATTVNSAISSAIGAVLNFRNQLVTNITNAFEAALGAAIRFGANMLGTLSALRANVTGVFDGAGSWLLDAGRQIVQGLINGIKSAIGGAVSAAAEMAASALAAAKGALGISSPSKEFIGVGMDVTRGLAIGLDRGRPLVEGAMATLAMAMPDMVSPSAVGAVGGGTTYNVVMESTVPATPAEVASSLRRVDLIYSGGR